MTSSSTLIFDLDGTLSDPAEGIARCINFALACHALAGINEDLVSRYIGPPLDESFQAITGSASEPLIKGLVAKFRERYADIGYAENVLYPGIPEVLTALATRGNRLGVCTSKRTDFAEKILTLFGIREHFAFVSGGEIGIQKYQQLEHLLKDGVVSASATMIGDRSVDILAAKRNQLRSVGVLWGHGSERELLDAGADQIFQTVAQLASLTTLPGAIK